MKSHQIPLYHHTWCRKLTPGRCLRDPGERFAHQPQRPRVLALTGGGFGQFGQQGLWDGAAECCEGRDGMGVTWCHWLNGEGF